MRRDTDDRFVDGIAMRLVAAAVVVACVGVLVYLNRDKLGGAPMPETAARNPEFVKCRDERVAQVQRMLDDGVIDKARFATFKDRAVATCAGQFPPENAAD